MPTANLHAHNPVELAAALTDLSDRAAATPPDQPTDALTHAHLALAAAIRLRATGRCPLETSSQADDRIRRYTDAAAADPASPTAPSLAVLAGAWAHLL